MVRHFRILFATILVFNFIFISCKKKTTTSQPDDWPTDSLRIVKNGLSHVWEMEWGPDNHIWFTQRNGRISKMDAKTGNIVLTHHITEVVSTGEGGLLGMALHPDFLVNGYLYVVYNYNSQSGYREKLVRLTFSGNILTNALTIIENIPASNIHNGSRVRVVNDGTGIKIYFTTGDAANAASAQDVTSRSGKVLRLNPDGSIPADNPLPNNPMWSYGHRNPQGLIYFNNRFYASEHGPSIEDEVNIIEKGRNYGWPNVNGPCDGSELAFCTANNVKEPIWSSGNVTIAVCGIAYYNHDRISSWKNSILMTTLKDASLRQLKLSTDGNSVTSVSTFYKNEFGRIRDVCVSPEGRVYLATSNGSNDVIVEISKP